MRCVCLCAYDERLSVSMRHMCVHTRVYCTHIWWLFTLYIIFARQVLWSYIKKSIKLCRLVRITYLYIVGSKHTLTHTHIGARRKERHRRSYFKLFRMWAHTYSIRMCAHCTHIYAQLLYVWCVWCAHVDFVYHRMCIQSTLDISVRRTDRPTNPATGRVQRRL